MRAIVVNHAYFNSDAVLGVKKLRNFRRFNALPQPRSHFDQEAGKPSFEFFEFAQYHTHSPPLL